MATRDDKPPVTGGGHRLPFAQLDPRRFEELCLWLVRREGYERVMRRALQILEASLGDDHPNVAVQLNNLAQLLQATNRLAEAEPLMRRSLEIHEASFGPEHPNVAFDLNNLAGLLQATDRLAEAELLMRRALEIFEASLGPDHPSTVTVRANLAAMTPAPP